MEKSYYFKFLSSKDPMKALTTLSQNPSPSTITMVGKSASQSAESNESALNLSMPKLEPVEDSKANRKF